MNIVYIITRSDSIGGAHVHVRDMATWMLSNGHRPNVVVGGEGPYIAELSRRGIPCSKVPSLVRPISPAHDFVALLELRKLLERLQPDLVSTHSSKAGWLGRIVARSLGLPVIFTAHGWAFTDGVPGTRRRFYILAERLAAGFSNRIITVSDYDRNLALKYRVAPMSKLVTVHNGVLDVTSMYRAQPSLQPPRLIMVARFEEQKDHQTLLQALANLQDLPWTLELVGDGPLRSVTESLARRLGIRNRIWFTGAVNNVADRLKKAQIFVLISRWEGFPRSILEAMRAGLPVLASDVGGVAEAVEDGVNGILVPRGDVNAVRTALRRLLTNPSIREIMGRRGRERFEREFTFDRMAEKTLQVYREVLAEHCRGRL